MTQTNQTYIEEKAQEIVEISQGHFVDYEWIDEDGTKGFSKAIPISFYKKWLRVALSDAIKYGEERGMNKLYQAIDARYKDFEITKAMGKILKSLNK